MHKRYYEVTPIKNTIPTQEPWVPLRILGLGLDRSQIVEADVFVLTDVRPQLLAGGPGLSLERNERASTALLDDLRSDKGMEWVPDDMWLTFLRLDVPAGDLDYDLAIAAHPGVLPALKDAGVTTTEARSVLETPPGRAVWPVVLGVGVGVATLLALGQIGRRRRTIGIAG
jgi:hypothetical protein